MNSKDSVCSSKSTYAGINCNSREERPPHPSTNCIQNSLLHTVSAGWPARDFHNVRNRLLCCLENMERWPRKPACQWTKKDSHRTSTVGISHPWSRCSFGQCGPRRIVIFYHYDVIFINTFHDCMKALCNHAMPCYMHSCHLVSTMLWLLSIFQPIYTSACEDEFSCY